MNSLIAVHLDSIVWTIKGLFGPETAVPDWTQVPTDKKIVLNLKDLKAINSAGLRDLILWFKKRPKTHEQPIEIHHAPHFVLETLQTISSHLPAELYFQSFYLNYHDETSDRFRKALFCRKASGKFEVPQEVWVLENGEDCTYRPDHFLNKTLRILGADALIYDFEKGILLLDADGE